MNADVCKLTDLTGSEIGQLPLDRLGLVVLRHIVDSEEWSSDNFILSMKQQKSLDDTALRYLSEALNWLISKNLISRGTPGQYHNPCAIFVTRQGHLVLDQGLDLLLARELLGVNLHALLQKVQSQFFIGEYELAAFAAMREVEIRVRELSEADSSLLGVSLMQQAFRKDGPLADSNLDPGEQVAIMNLFAGSIGTFKNPSSHRQVDYNDPTEASEVVLLADLLMRMLDRIEIRL